MILYPDDLAIRIFDNQTPEWFNIRTWASPDTENPDISQLRYLLRCVPQFSPDRIPVCSCRRRCEPGCETRPDHLDIHVPCKRAGKVRWDCIRLYYETNSNNAKAAIVIVIWIYNRGCSMVKKVKCNKANDKLWSPNQYFSKKCEKFRSKDLNKYYYKNFEYNILHQHFVDRGLHKNKSYVSLITLPFYTNG